MTRSVVALLRFLGSVAYGVGWLAERVESVCAVTANRLVERYRVRTEGEGQQ